MVETFSNWLKLISCGTTPRHDFAASRSVSMSWPKTPTVPPVLLTSDDTMPIVVDLPAPLGPSSAKKSPSATSRSMPFKACTPLRYVLLSWRSDRAFIDEVDQRPGGGAKR